MPTAAVPLLPYLLRSTAVALGVGALAAVAGHLLAGGPGLAGAAVGAAAALLGCWLGHAPLWVARQRPDLLEAAALAGIGVRLLGTLALAGLLLLLLPFPREAVAIGLVLPYLSLLALEVREVVAIGRRLPSAPGRAGASPEAQRHGAEHDDHETTVTR